MGLSIVLILPTIAATQVTVSLRTSEKLTASDVAPILLLAATTFCELSSTTIGFSDKLRLGAGIVWMAPASYTRSVHSYRPSSGGGMTVAKLYRVSGMVPSIRIDKF